MSQIRIQKTPEIKEMLTFLKRRYLILSEAEIIKFMLAEKYQEEKNSRSSDEEVRKAYKEAMAEGKKLGDKMLASKGLKREDVSEQEFYDLFLDDHKND